MQISGLGGGGMSMSMLQNMQQQMFQAADTGNKGYLTVDDFQKMKGPDGAPQLSATDKANIFKKLDADGDGKLTQDEMKPKAGDKPPSMSADMMSSLLTAQSNAGDSASTQNDLLDQLMKMLDSGSNHSTTKVAA